ncbi:MAG: branched-chain amino acid ABC transporter substrate-binding protein [Actinomycetota bacterium]
MYLRRLAIALLVGLVPAGLVACSDDSAGSSGSDVPPEKVVTIGVEVPIEEGLTDYGIGIRNSVQLAVDQANAVGLLPGWKIEVAVVDDSSDPDVGGRNAAELIEDPSLVAVIGPANSGVAAVIAPKFSEAGIAVISPANTDPELTRGSDPAAPERQFASYFRMVATEAEQGPFLARYAYEDAGFRTAAVIADPKEVNRLQAEAFRDAFTAAGGTVALSEVVPDVGADGGPVVGRIAAARPDVVFYAGDYEPAAALKRQLLAADVTVPLMGGDGIAAPEYITAVGAAGAAGDLASSVGSPVEQQPNGDVFVAAYERADFGAPPSNYGPYAYDATAIVLQVLTTALAEVDRVDSNVRAAVIAGLGTATSEPVAAVERTLNDAPDGFARGAVTGAIGFDEYGDTTNRILTIYTVRDGAWAPVVTRKFAD